MCRKSGDSITESFDGLGFIFQLEYSFDSCGRCFVRKNLPTEGNANTIKCASGGQQNSLGAES